MLAKNQSGGEFSSLNVWHNLREMLAPDLKTGALMKIYVPYSKDKPFLWNPKYDGAKN